MKSKKHAGSPKPKNGFQSAKVRMPLELYFQVKKAATEQARTFNNMAVFFLTRGVTHLEAMMKADSPDHHSTASPKSRPSTK